MTVCRLWKYSGRSHCRGDQQISRKTTAAILMYSAWNIWKECNRRTFEGTRQTPVQVLRLIKEELGLFGKASGEIRVTTMNILFIISMLFMSLSGLNNVRTKLL
jgi:hypothetical protein